MRGKAHLRCEAEGPGGKLRQRTRFEQNYGGLISQSVGRADSAQPATDNGHIDAKITIERGISLLVWIDLPAASVRQVGPMTDESRTLR